MISKKQIYHVAVGLCFVYFLVRTVYFALTIPHFIPPDEITHFDYCVIFSHALWLPENSESTYSVGNVVHIPWVYYYCMGKFLSLNFSPFSDLVYLRFINIILSCSALLYGFCWMSLITERRITKLFFLVLITNIPMFTFLSASVTYDNLVNLCAIAMLYYVHKFFYTGRTVCFLSAGISMFVGVLTKISFLPFSAILSGLFFVHEYRRLHSSKSGIFFPLRCIKHKIKELSSIELFLSVILLLFFILSVNLYGTNVIRYKKLLPMASQIMTKQQFMQQRIVARDYVIDQYRSGNVSYQDAVAMARKISHPSDQKTALHVLKILSAKENEPIFMSRLAYSYHWINVILESIVCISGHRSMVKTANELIIYKTIFLLLFLVVVRYWQYDCPGFIVNQSVLIVAGYSLFLMFYHNYAIYLWSMNPLQGLQGRYIFPVLVPFLGVMAYYLSDYLNKSLSCILVILISLFFIWGDFPYFYTHADVAWFRPLEDNLYYYQRAKSFQENGDLIPAICELRKAIELTPENAWYHRFLGDWLRETGAQKEALEQYLVAIKLQPGTAGFYYFAGRASEELDLFDKTVQNYSAAIGLEPDNPWYHRFFGDFYRNERMIDKAMVQYREVLRIEPDNVYCHKEIKRIADVSVDNSNVKDYEKRF